MGTDVLDASGPATCALRRYPPTLTRRLVDGNATPVRTDEVRRVGCGIGTGLKDVSEQ